MEEMRGDGRKHEEDGKHDEKKIDGRHLMEGNKMEEMRAREKDDDGK